MSFDIRDGKTTVTTEMNVIPNPSLSEADPNGVLELDGDESSVKLLSISVDGRDMVEGEDYMIAPGRLVVKSCALKEGKGVVKTVVEICPEENTQLSGLYKSGSMYCSQCEAMGFRRITYYPDRPDNMAIFSRVRIEADLESYPVLLGNGNLLEEGVVEDVGEDGRKRHYSVWEDPFPKPSYLFCIVAGNLAKITDKYTTSSGLNVDLAVYSEPENVNQLDYAMESLVRSMEWDERKFGLEYDLGMYNIVAVDDFNMGAMENKGLNVFNTAYVLADPQTASDTDYTRVEGVIGHEYFHNWTGNRVTCRDWFQLTLKEGLTVFRDQEFSGDYGSKAVVRVESVVGLRGRQFGEDAGPMSHPVRPDSYISMDNFYTATVYSKGAEIVRMYNTMLGEEGFRKGMDLYFKRHDGDAVTCDDFRSAMADANGIDFTQFGRWYSTPGTPSVTYSTDYDADSKTYKITFTQESKSEDGLPLHIPISTGLISRKSGKELVPTTVLELKETTQTFEFPNMEEDGDDIVPSLLRDFSAPIKLTPVALVDESDLAFLAARDTDGFNRWEAGQRLFTSILFQTLEGDRGADDAAAEFDLEESTTMDSVNAAFELTLNDDSMESSIKAYALTLPSETTLAEEIGTDIDPVALLAARGKVKLAIARKHQTALRDLYDSLSKEMDSEGGEFKVDAVSIGRRRLRNVVLSYLTATTDTPEEELAAAALATSHYDQATGMTDKMAALSALASMEGSAAPARDAALTRFFEEADGNSLVLNKWFGVQAMASLPDVLDRVKKLMDHPDFTFRNPNRFRSLINSFVANAAPFHAEDGSGYRFVADATAEIDKLNPQVSSRLATGLVGWKKYGTKRGALMKAELERLRGMDGLSEDLFEVVERGLK